MQRFRDQTLANDGAVGVGGVDEIDSQLDRASQDCDCLGMIGRFSPDAIAGELHCTEPEPANWNIATNQKCSARLSWASVGRARMCFCCIGLLHNFGHLPHGQKHYTSMVRTKPISAISHRTTIARIG